MDSEFKDKTQQELRSLKAYYDVVLGTLESGVLVLDPNDIIISENEKVVKLWELSDKITGQKLQNTELWQKCPELKESLNESRKGQPHSADFECYANPGTAVKVTIKPILPASGPGTETLGTLIYMENVMPQVTLQSTMEEQETTAAELQSTNEELETTNEELQSTNEELETTNEELQSTNEELETTNEELASLNEELETTNEELSSRTRELEDVNARYSEMMERMPWPVFLVNEDGAIYMFNSAAQGLLGFASPSVNGMKLKELPLDGKSRRLLEERYNSVVSSHASTVLRNRLISTNQFKGLVNVHFIPLSKGSASHGVIVMFEQKDGARQQPGLRAVKPKKAGTRTSPAGNSTKRAAKKKARAKRKTGR